MRICLSLLFLNLSLIAFAQKEKSAISFTLSVPDPASQKYHVEMISSGNKEDLVEFKMPVWTPGYYQILDYAKYVSDFAASDEKGNQLKWEKTGKNVWKVTKGKRKKQTDPYRL